MQVKKTNTSDTKVVLTVATAEAEMEPIKTSVVKRLGSGVKLAGFRSGKAPMPLVEKSLDQSLLQTEFLNDAVNQLYVAALEEYRLRPVDRPQVTIKKFMPFTELEFDAEVEVVGDIKLADYKKIKKSRQPVKVTAKDIDEVIAALRKRTAERKDVDRAAKEGDEVWIDFSGKDAKGEPVKGADGKDYPLILGSNTFIPGFEPNLIGLKTGQEKTFTIPFPKGYGVKALAGKKVTFTVTVKKVQEVIEPKLDDAFAATAGPFKTVAELKEDIKKQLAVERQQEADRALENDLIMEITAKSKLAAPQALIDEQIERLLRDLKQNLTYRGQTYEEFLESQNTDEERYRKEVLTPQAEERVKAGLVLSEISEAEGLDVTPEELESRMQALKSQYKDPAMQAELDKPETRRDIASRILTEKTVSALVSYSTK